MFTVYTPELIGQTGFWLTCSILKPDNTGILNVARRRTRAVGAGFEVDVEQDEVDYYQENSVSEMVDSRHGVRLDSKYD